MCQRERWKTRGRNRAWYAVLLLVEESQGQPLSPLWKRRQRKGMHIPSGLRIFRVSLSSSLSLCLSPSYCCRCSLASLHLPFCFFFFTCVLWRRLCPAHISCFSAVRSDLPFSLFFVFCRLREMCDMYVWVCSLFYFIQFLCFPIHVEARFSGEFSLCGSFSLFVSLLLALHSTVYVCVTRDEPEAGAEVNFQGSALGRACRRKVSTPIQDCVRVCFGSNKARKTPHGMTGKWKMREEHTAAPTGTAITVYDG
jgi:hypothetical protein